MHRTWGKPDRNQRDIIDGLLRIGVSVLRLSPLGNGCPDLLCSHRGFVCLLEVKAPKALLRPAQVRWHMTWDPFCPVYVVTNVTEAIHAATGQLR